MLIKIEIDKKNIEKNLIKIRKINDNIICVLKDDAYGLGIENILPVLIENNCRYFAAAYISEAFKIRRLIEKDYPDILGEISIMTLNYIEESEIKKVLKNDIEITIFNFKQLEKYIEALKRFDILKNNKKNSNIIKKNDNFKDTEVVGNNIEKNNKLKIHIKLNTGMNRLGFDEEEIEKLIKILEENPNLDIISVYSHIFNVENEKETENQITKYDRVVSLFDKNKIKYRFKHIQASPLLFKYGKKYNYDFVRTGMAMYGMEPLFESSGLYNAVKVISKVINIRKIKRGEKISYGNKNTLKENKTVAVIPIGYAHGLQKQIENKEAYVLVHGEKAKILGEICMDMIIVDITHIKNVQIDDEAVIIGKQGKEEITLLKMSEWAETIQDDILTKWDKEIKRILI
jgi:alanine racemase